MVYSPITQIWKWNFIKDITFMNATTRAKIIWRLITGSMDWWKEEISQKKILGMRKICISPIIRFKRINSLEVIKTS
jgi:hypothetical protein